MGVFDWLQQHIVQPVEGEIHQVTPAIQNARNAVLNSVHNFNAGNTSWQQAGQNFLNQHIVQPVQQEFNPANDTAATRAIDYLNSGNSPIGENGYFNKQVIQPVGNGISNFAQHPSWSTAGTGLLDVGRGTYNATPLGLAANSAIGATSSVAQALRTGGADPFQAINNNQQLSQGLGITGPAGTALDFATNLAATNPEGLAQAASKLGTLSKDATLAQNLGSVAGAAKNVFLGADHETLSANLTDTEKAAQNIRSNPLLSDAEKSGQLAELAKIPKQQVDLVNSINQSRQAQAKPVETPYNTAAAQERPIPELNPQTAGMAPKEQAYSAISAMKAAQQKIELSAQIALQSAKDAKLEGNDATLFRDSLEHPEDLQANLGNIKNVKGFNDAMQRYRGFTNDVYRVGTETGREYPFRSNYYNHEFDRNLLPPEAQQEFQDFSNQQLNKNAGSKSEAPRVFQDLREAKQYGEYLQQKYSLDKNPFVQKNGSVTQDIQDLSSRSQKAAGSSAFVQELKRVAPHDVAVGSEGGIPRGFLQLHVPGLQDTFVSPELYKHLKVLEPSVFADNPIVHAIDKANAGVKGFVLQGPFHALKETINFAGDQLAHLRLPNFAESTKLALSPASFATYLQGLKDSGFLDIASNLNLKIGGTDFEDLAKNQMSMKSMTFGRIIPYYKLESLQTALKSANLDLSTPEGLAEGRKVAAQVNNFYGGLQNDLNGRNKTVQQILRLVTLAPDFNEGKIRTGVSALLDWNTAAGSLARRQALGSAAVTALGVEIARRFATGHWDGLKDGLQNTVLNPNIPLPSQFNKPGSTTQQTVNVPASVGGDLYRFVTNPAQALQSRGSSLLSLEEKIRTGKDYYGNPLVNPFQNPNPSFLDNAKAVITSGAELPIPLQNALSAFQGKISPGAAVINSLGGRVGNNPQDPKQIANTAYYNNLDTFTKGLNPNEQSLFSTLNPIKKDPDGNPVFNKATTTSSANAAELASQPGFAQKYAAFQRQNGSLDPVYNLQGNDLINALQARAAVGTAGKSSLDPNFQGGANSQKNAAIYLNNMDLFSGQAAYEKQNATHDPIYDLPRIQGGQNPDLNVPSANAVLYVRANDLGGQNNGLVTAIKAQPWYKQFTASESSYYNANPLPASAKAPSGPQYPTMSPELQAFQKYISSLPTGTGAKTAAYNSPQGQALTQYYNTVDQYQNQKLGQVGLPAGYVPSTQYAGELAAIGTAGSSGTSSSSSVSNALAKSAAHRNARKIISSQNKSSGIKRSKVKMPKFKTINVKSHVRRVAIKPITTGFNARPAGKVNRPTGRTA